MDQLSIISDSLTSLQNLAAKDRIPLDEVQSKFKEDLMTFIKGETISMVEGKIIIGLNLYKKWLVKIRTKGFDYEIDFK